MFGSPSPRPSSRRSLLDLEVLDSRDVPAIATLPDYYQATEGSVTSVPKERGLLANDFSTTNFGAVVRVTGNSAPVLFDLGAGGPNANVLAIPLPDNTLVVNPDGSFTLTLPSNLPAITLGLGFSYTTDNALDPTEPGGTAFSIVYINRSVADRFGVSTRAGTTNVVEVFEAGSGNKIQTIQPYEPSYTGGVEVAVGDLTGDGVPDVATAPGVGGSSLVKVFDGRTGRELFSILPYEESFRGGAHVAIGDVNGDGFNDLVVGAGVGGGPRVIVFNGQTFLPLQPTLASGNAYSPGPTLSINGVVVVADVLMDFFAYESSFRGGVRVAAGDVDGVGRDFVITSPGAGGGPAVKTFDFNEVVGPLTLVSNLLDPNNVTQIRQPLNLDGLNVGGTATPSLSFMAGDDRDRSGVYISTADLDGDGRADILTGTATGPAVVQVFDGRTGAYISQIGIVYLSNPGTDGSIGTGPLASFQQPSGILLGPVTTPTSLIPGETSGLGGTSPIPANDPALANGGVTVLGFDFDGDGKDEIIAGPGPGNAARIRILKADGTDLTNLLAYPGTVLSGVNVG